ncbi:MAG: pectinesterase family protein [Verrucomicrobiota bacterium]
MKTLIFLLFTHLLAILPLYAVEEDHHADATVSATGEEDFKTVQEAINKAPQTASSEKPWVIFVKPGTYAERVYVQREKRHIRLIGEDAATTHISFGLFARMKGPDGLEIGTFRTPTMTIDADDFTVEKLTLANSAGPVGQALALRVDGDRVVFRDCVFTGYQDTIFLNRGRQYFQNCTVRGDVDFIFGGATAWFESCTLDCIRNGYITASSTPAESRFGFVFANCTIITSPDIKVYLGRPWRPFASTIFINTKMGSGIRPEAWHNWDQPEREKTSRYAESNSHGPGAQPDKRVPWAKQLTQTEVEKITRTEVLNGWNP